MQCESWENGPIVHNGIEKKNEKLSVHNITSHLRLNLPDSTSVPSSHPIVKPCSVRRTPSNSEGSEPGIHLVSSELFVLCNPSFDEFVMFDSSLVLLSLLLAHRGLFMCSGQSFKFPHRAVFRRTVMDFDWASRTSTRGTGDPDRDLLAASLTLSHHLLSHCMMSLNIRSYLRALNLSHCAPIDRRYSQTRTSRSRAALISNWRHSHNSTARDLSQRHSNMSCWTLDSNI